MSRIELGGLGVPIPALAMPDPLLTSDTPAQLLSLKTGNFDKTPYVALGYNYYEVWCVGAPGGRGGVVMVSSSYWAWRSIGGAGGGGGLQYVSGRLADLPTLSPVVVGVAGALGTDSKNNASIPASIGHDGGPSTFLYPLCRASGGKYGMVSTLGYGVTPQKFWEIRPGGDGGEGGLGGRDQAGGGGMGSYGLPSVLKYWENESRWWHVTVAKDGNWDGSIGGGGGGGQGGTYVSSTDFRLTTKPKPAARPAFVGGQGSFSNYDPSVMGARGPITVDRYTATRIVPGGGGGARPLPQLLYGAQVPSYFPVGLVLIRLTKRT